MSSASPISKLCSMPMDVLAIILSLLRPVHIIQARLTCHRLRDATMHRVVWVEALHGVLLEHGVPLATFPIDKLDQPTLEHLSVSPRRFRWKLKAASQKPQKSISPNAARYVLRDPSEKHLTKRQIAELPKFQWLELCPGGRFMVSVRLAHMTGDGGQFSHFIQLWDLGIPGLDKRPRTITGNTLGVPITKTANWKKDRFTLSRSHTTPSSLRLDIYREFADATTLVPEMACISLLISAEALRPAITLLGNRRITKPMDSHLVHHGLFIGCTPGFVYACTDRGVLTTCHLPDEFTSKAARAIHVFGGRLFLLLNDQLVQLEIPSTPGPHANLDFVSSNSVGLPGTTAANRFQLQALRFSSWLELSTLSDFLIFFQRSDSRLAVYRMDPVPVPSVDGLTSTPDIFPRCVRRYSATFEIGQVAHSPARPCDGHLVFTSRDSPAASEIRMHLVPTDTSADPIGCVKTKWLEFRKAMARRHSLCPLSGRLCILTDNDEIVLLEFLKASC